MRCLSSIPRFFLPFSRIRSYLVGGESSPFDVVAIVGVLCVMGAATFEHK
jgi:hypothetical protein